MKHGAIRSLRWAEPALTNDAALANFAAPTVATAAPRLDPEPTSAEEEAVALLRIAAEIEGSLLAQYLFAAGSIVTGLSVNAPGFDHPIQTDDWLDVIRTIAQQEMGHLITVQNLLLSLGAPPHIDRENLPHTSPLFPFPFGLQPISLKTVAKFVAAEAPHQVAASDQTDYAEAVSLAGMTAGEIPRAGQIYERLFWLFQDTDTPQAPWPDLQNPFPTWEKWHVGPANIGLNQDRQGSPGEWRGSDNTEPPDPDNATYVLQVRDKPSAREAVFAIGLQGEGPITGQSAVTHFDKFLRIYREVRAVDGQPGPPGYAREQAPDPRTGLGGTQTINDNATLLWAKLGNTRYQMLLMDISLALSIGQAGAVRSTTASRKDFTTWAFREMQTAVRPLSAELRQMPLGAGPDSPRAGFPFELPIGDLPTTATEQVARLRELLATSKQLRAEIGSTLSLRPSQAGILKVLDTIDTGVGQKLG